MSNGFSQFDKMYNDDGYHYFTAGVVVSAITKALILYGIERQRYKDHTNSYFSVDFDTLHFSFNTAYSVLDLSFYWQPANTKRSVDRRSLNTERLLGRGESLTFEQEVAQKTAMIIHAMLPGIVQDNSVGRCQSPYHSTSPIGYGGILYSAGNDWFCDSCLSRLNVTDELAPNLLLPNGNQKPKRDYLSVGMRFDVFHRDNFTCRSCGRTPRTDNVKLHVDHIRPVAKGGKTEISNLQTLCQDCNLGKSDKIIEQMVMWNE